MSICTIPRGRPGHESGCWHNKNPKWQEWTRVPSCDLCPKPAAWAHPLGGFRCETCPRPTEKPKKKR